MTQQPPSVAQVFDTIAAIYDQSGVPFFGPVGERLVELLAPASGEHCLDIGCGRGAVTVPLARAVGPTGSVRAVDISEAMVAATRELTEQLGLDQVLVERADAGQVEAASCDVVASSLVLFFLPDPLAALRSWVEALAPGGRIGLTTFGQLDEATRQIDDLLAPYAPPGLRDPRTAGAESPFGSDERMEALLRAAGAGAIRTVSEPAVVEFDDVDTWHRFAMATGQRAMLARVPEAELPGLLDRIAGLLDDTRVDGGPARLVWQMRYTLGSA